MANGDSNGAFPAGVPGLAAFIASIEAAQMKFACGDPHDFKALWSHTPDVTLSGGLGGKIEIGWPFVAERLDWASSNYGGGKRSWQHVAGSAAGDMAYVVLKEVIEGEIAGASQRQELRVTMVFRRLSEGWRIVHRHADSQTAAA